MTPLILVVDDDSHVRNLLVRFLAEEGYPSIVATNGEEALAIVKREPPDLILLDVDMPVMDGLETCRRLKNDERTALIPVTMITGRTDDSDRTEGIEAGADDFLNKPFDEATLRARIRTQLRLKRITDQLEHTESVIFSMARWVEMKDHYTEGHLRRVAGFSERTAREIGLARDEQVAIRYAGILHDIGKIAVPEAILRKNGPLSLDEQEVLQKHPDHGAEIIAPMRFAASVGPIIRAHHERWDGLGYPCHLRGEDIPIGARIVAVADAWDAMTTARPYRGSLDIAEAERRLREGAGSQWDERIVGLLLELYLRGELASLDAPVPQPSPF